MRFRAAVPIGILGLFVVTATACSSGAPSSAPGTLPAAGTAAAHVAGPLGAQRLGRVRHSVDGCSGSGTNSFVGGTDGNFAAGADSGVLSGGVNDACDGGSGIIAGRSNIINSSGESFDEIIGAGYNNAIGGTGGYSFIGAGQSNSIAAGYNQFIGAGADNSVSGTDGFIGAGYKNAVSGQYASVAGGDTNTATGTASTAAGGIANLASGYASFAAGSHADADEAGSFVWSDDSSSATTKATAVNEFVARTAGGVKFFSNSAMTTGVSLAAGGGSWASVSDRAVKTNVESIDDARILDKVASMPISEWSYISEHGVRHVGPMAQDFYAAFGVGEDDKHITSIDEDGVALAAIKALNAQLLRTNSRLAQKDAALQRQMTAMKNQMTQLAAKVATIR